MSEASGPDELRVAGAAGACGSGLRGAVGEGLSGPDDDSIEGVELAGTEGSGAGTVPLGGPTSDDGGIDCGTTMSEASVGFAFDRAG